MNRKGIEKLLYSAVGVVAVVVIVIAVNAAASALRLRVDLTEERAFTLSDGTRAILAKLDTPVTIRFYFATLEESTQEALFIKEYARQVEDLLREYVRAAGGRLKIEKLNPQPDSDAEDSANLDGIQGQQLETGEKLYLGLAVSCVDQKSVLPFLSPARERLLEYDISRAIASVAKPDKPVIAVMTGLPVFGQPFNPMMMRMGQRGGSDPWVVVSELRRDFTVRQLDLTVEKIDDDIQVLLVIHPKDVSEKTQFAIDQFVLRGGKLIAFLDPLAMTDSAGANPMGFNPPSSSSLDKLLAAWGVTFDRAKVVADMNFATPLMRQGSQRPEMTPTVLMLNREAMSQDDPLTGQLDRMLMWYAGAFTGTPAEGLRQTTILKSTIASSLVDAFTAQLSAQQTAKEFKASGKEYPLAIRLTGKFKTAFPDGPPGARTDDAETKADGEKPATNAPPASLTESKEENVVVLIGDADMLEDRSCVEKMNFFGQQVITLTTGNLPFLQGLTEQMSGDINLMAMRSRASLSRPFLLIRKMEAQAEERFRARISQLEQTLQETQGKLAELQRDKDKSQRFIRSPEQQAELDRFLAEQARANRDLKNVRKELRQDIESLKTRLKWLNIAGMPLLVTASGITIALFKRKRTAAK